MKCSLSAVIVTSILIFASALTANAQATDCPTDKVCISREAALKAIADADRVKALEAEIKVKDTAIDGYKTELANIRIEFARASGELTGLRTAQVQNTALIDLLLRQTRKKCLPFTICL